jgi:hypothetical protein
MFELDWVAEPSYFVGNGPLFDNEGNLYFSPQFYHGERVVLVSLDGKPNEGLSLFSYAVNYIYGGGGVVIMIGGGKKLLGRTLMLHMGMGLLDRETGKLRYFAEGRDVFWQ